MVRMVYKKHSLVAKWAKQNISDILAVTHIKWINQTTKDIIYLTLLLHFKSI